MKKGIDILQEVLQELLEEKREKETMGKLKRCSKCKQEKPADHAHFYKDSGSKTGLMYYCIECSRAAIADRKQKKDTPGKIKAEDKIKGKRPVKKDMEITLDFSNNEILYKDILLKAVDELRTPAMQVMWLASNSLYQERSMQNEHD